MSVAESTKMRGTRVKAETERLSYFMEADGVSGLEEYGNPPWYHPRITRVEAGTIF